MKNFKLTLMLTLAAFAASVQAEYMCMPPDLDGALPKPSSKHARIATFNAYLNRFNEGDLIRDLQNPDNAQARAVAEIIQRVRPDVILLNEFDYDAAGTAIELFQTNYLGLSQNGQAPIHYPFVFSAPSNTGIPSGVDFNNDGNTSGPDDAYGFGFFPGQYGMVLLSKHPIAEKHARTFQNFRWRDMPGAKLPKDFASGGSYYSAEALNIFRLSSKSHWDVPVWINGELVHVLSAHPTPPVFDGAEDRNGLRNHDEIRFWADYIEGGRQAAYIYDDKGRRGGLHRHARFVILGDYNADPVDGDSTDKAIDQLLQNSDINAAVVPASIGGWEDAELEGDFNDLHLANAAMDTGDFNPGGPGNLRVDYVLPSKKGLKTVCGGVFWPAEKDQTRYLVGSGFPVVSSDHHLVWLDLKIKRD